MNPFTPEYDRFFQLVPVPAVLADAEGIARDLNAAFLDLARRTGRREAREDWIGRPVADWGRAEDGEKMAALRREAQRDGTALPVEVEGVQIRAVALTGSRDQVVFLWEDIREGHQVEEALSRTQSLEMFSQIGSGVAHDINNSLSLVTGFAGLLLEGEVEETLRQNLETILEGARRTEVAAGRLMRFARRLRANPERVELNPLVEDTVALMRRMFERRGMELRADLAPDLPLVEVHAGQIQVALMNLLQNSREAILGSGEQKGRVQVRTRAVESGVAVEVEDNGPGLPEELRLRVFELFFTTKEATPGAGEGLSVCQRIARNHGGQVRLANTTSGTCAVLELPVTEERAGPALYL